MVESEYITLKEARELLGTTRATMSRIVREKALKIYRDPLDKRKKLVLRKDVEALRRPRPNST